MTKFVPILVAAAMLSALPATGFASTQVANSATSKLCSDDAPDSYKRPGGFCDQVDDLKSLTPTSIDTCNVADAGFRFDEIEGLLRVGVAYDPCCRNVTFNIDQQLPADGILVADNSCAP